MNILKYIFDGYNNFKEKDLFIKIFQGVLFLWIFSIPLKSSIYQICTVLIIVLFFVHYIYNKQKTLLIEVLITYKRLLLIYFFFILAMILSSILGVGDKSTLTDILKYFFRYLLILVILLYFYKQRFYGRKWLLTVIFIALFMHALDGIYQYITGFDLILNKLTSQSTYKLTGAVYHHNPFGLFMAIGASISLVLFLSNNNYTMFKCDKYIYLITLIIFLFTLFHSQSRSAWTMFGIYFIGYIFIYLKENGFNKKLVFTLLLLLITISMLFLFDNNLLKRLNLLFQGHSSGRTTLIWPFTVEKIMNSPILGYGINTYKLVAHGHNARFQAGVHNIFLELLLYTGIIGFSIFTYLIWLTLKESFTKDKIVYFILFVSFIVLMQFDGSLIDSKVHINIFILMLFFIFSFRLDKKSSA